MCNFGLFCCPRILSYFLLSLKMDQGVPISAAVYNFFPVHKSLIGMGMKYDLMSFVIC